MKNRNPDGFVKIRFSKPSLSERTVVMPRTITRYPKEVILKDHREVFLRPFEAGDIEKLAEFYISLQLSLRWFLKEDPCDLSVIKKWIDN